MLIHKMLNNNAVLAYNQDGEELIVTGKGIAFKKKNGDELDEQQIEKVFSLKNAELKNRFQELIMEIPLDCISLSEEIIHMLHEHYTKSIHDNIYITLTDHIANLLERVQMGIVFHNMLLWDAKRIYPEEYALGIIACDMIHRKLDIKVDHDEASFIALHIVNANMNVEIEQTMKISETIEGLQNIIQHSFPDSLHRNEYDYQRFMLHLRFFFKRLVTQQEQDSADPEHTVENLIMLLTQSYPLQHLCVNEMSAYIEQHMKMRVIRGEELYLLIHVIKITDTKTGGEQ